MKKLIRESLFEINNASHVKNKIFKITWKYFTNEKIVNEKSTYLTYASEWHTA